MIIEWLLDAFGLAVAAVASAFPTTGVDPLAGLLLTVQNVAALNYFLPIAETFVLVIGVLFIFPVFMGVTLFVWCLALIRGGSARG